MRISEEISKKLDEIGFGVPTIHVDLQKNFTVLEPEDVISTMVVTVNAFDDSTDDCKDILRAVINILPSEFKGRIVDGNFYTTELDPVLNEIEYDMFDAADSDSQELTDVCEAIKVLDHWDIVEDDNDEIHEFLNISDLYYLARFQVEESCRNIGLGSYILEKLPEIISATLNEECVLLVTYPAPLEVEHNTKEWEDGRKRLKNFYKKAGYSKVYKTNYMYFTKEVFVR